MVVLIDDIQINGISIVRDGVGFLTQIRDELEALSLVAFPSKLNAALAARDCRKGLKPSPSTGGARHMIALEW
jgi:hypothetical protein